MSSSSVAMEMQVNKIVSLYHPPLPTRITEKMSCCMGLHALSEDTCTMAASEGMWLD